MGADFIGEMQDYEAMETLTLPWRFTPGVQLTHNP
jgi:hypothetical protein